MSPYADADFTYEDFLPEDVVAAFKYAVVFQQEYARFVRYLAIELVGGEIDNMGGRREYVRTRLGLFRICVNDASDNTTETAAHDENGAEIINFANGERRRRFWRAHLGQGAPADRTFQAKILEWAVAQGEGRR